MLFCDLRNCVLDGLDLCSVEFLGCRLNGTSFQTATLRETKFIGCFSGHQGSPTDFRNCTWEDVSVVDSHLHCLSDRNAFSFPHWPAEVVDAAWDTLTRNVLIHKALRQLEELGNPVVAPLLACLLADNDWDAWDVRMVVLEVLGLLRQFQLKFPNRDQVLLEWMFRCLGDEHSLVRQTASGLVKTLSPADNLILPSIRRMMGRSSKEKLAGLRAARELFYLDHQYSRLVNLKTLSSLLSDEEEEVRNQSQSFFDDYTYHRKQIQQAAAQKQAQVKQTATYDVAQALIPTATTQDNQDPNQLHIVDEVQIPTPEYRDPNRSFTIEGEIYMLQRRPMHSQVVANDRYQGIRVLDPWRETQVLQVGFPKGYDSYGIINGWCFRADGKAALVLNEQSRTAALLSLEAEGASYTLKCPPLPEFTDLRYIWETDSFWLTGGKSVGYFNLQWQEGKPALAEKGGIHARIAHRTWCRAVDKIAVFKSQVLRVEPDLSQMLYYDASLAPETIRVVNWRTSAMWSAPAFEYVPIIAFYKGQMFLMYEHEVHAINQQGQLETVYSAPLGFYCGGMDTIPAQDVYPAILVLACSSWNEPRHSLILVYQLDNY